MEVAIREKIKGNLTIVFSISHLSFLTTVISF